ncbi:Putative glycoside hydrolase, family 35, Galactose-binding-like domain superfamily [Septoria linicola]|uniref:Beta-galactosidase n=1 Tax=Septoria linicola TaxID=215465 RepID=A0A9Q9B3D9_9PEZI|nr:Putative glycoside hydrolase, family 35, Galactose-binding-like domain superfamily [Septoria linicola]
MLFRKLCLAALLSVAAVETAALAIGGKPNMMIKPYKRNEPLQDVVTWDEHSLFVHGERVLFYSGEFHPFRLPVPGLWLDVFQKIRALGYNGVSVYWDWALLEGKQGDFSAEGIFALEPFFEAAQQAGIFILARPGPYINAEVSGGGFPGWLQRNPGKLRTRDPRFLEATDNYVASMSKIIAKAQITNGGPVVLLQPENEYSQATADTPEFPDSVYWQYVEDQYRNGGIIVPMISNDAYPHGYFAPGPPALYNATIDIYGHDGYPLGFDCANPYTWPDNALPTYYGDLHRNQSISTPYSVIEFQGGSFDPWGGLGFAQCTKLLGPEFERVFYKNVYSFGVTIFNIYMTYGGTNWGGISHPGGYTSYDYGAVITEERGVDREKYSQAKLLANFLLASPAYLTAVAQDNDYANGSYTGDSAIATTALLGNWTNFFVVRHAAYNSLETTEYSITLPTSKGNITVPQLGGKLSLHGRDSKVYVTDYDVGGSNLLYSTAEIFTWKKYGDKRVLVIYTGPGETNELAFTSCSKATVVEGSGVDIKNKNDATILHFETSTSQRVVDIDDDLTVFIVDRNSAYDYWVADSGAMPSVSAPIIKAGYLIRNATVEHDALHLVGDLNATTPIEIIGGAPQPLGKLTFNGKELQFKQSNAGVVTATADYTRPDYSIPDLSATQWKVLNTLPEAQADYDDSKWPAADLTFSNNTARNLTTPTSLYASDYGFHTGNLIFRAHFTATGNESSVFLWTQGGSAFGHSVWLDGKFVGSFAGAAIYSNTNATYQLPSTTAGKESVLTVLIDNQGLDENGQAGQAQMKNPRGVLDYSVAGHAKSDVKWKLTGNLGGEDYKDRARGPLNEGGLYAERQGYHLPGAPIDSWKSSGGPSEGLSAPGVAFYAANIKLDFPTGYDIPLAFSFNNATANGTSSTNGTLATAYRAQLYVNGYQFGKYVHNIGPQDVFPVPEGIFNHRGDNYIAVSLWALEEGGAKVDGLKLVAQSEVQTGYGAVEASPQPAWEEREGAY